MLKINHLIPALAVIGDFMRGFVFFLISMMMTVGTALAQAPGPIAAENLSGWDSTHVSVGVAAVVTPEFEGSDKHDFKALPIIDIMLNDGKYFISTTRGAGVSWRVGDFFSFGPVIKYRFGRDEDDSRLLKGLGDVDGGFELGGYAAWRVPNLIRYYDTTSKPNLNFDATLEFLHGLGSAKGWQAKMGTGLGYGVQESYMVNLGVNAVYADKDYQHEYFGISDRQSQKSRYERYSPDGGLKHVAVSTSLNIWLASDWQVNIFGEYRRLTGDAADSPLVKAGSPNQTMGGVALVWRFNP
ncbi:hypothetical protein C4J81_06820 [Deltaproteobacteria bacterium Smac51]|nr:hypothetical protein C4J81_06820 [Deltaproteobacteria bacterium Smac51]